MNIIECPELCKENRVDVTPEEMFEAIDGELQCAADGRDHATMQKEMGLHNDSFAPTLIDWYDKRWFVFMAIRSILSDYFLLSSTTDKIRNAGEKISLDK